MKKRKTHKIRSYNFAGGSSILVGLPPFETVAKALAALKPGETVYLRAESYLENCTAHGNTGQGIRVKNTGKRSTNNEPST